MTSELPRGTPCYLVALIDRPEFVGRVVEVVEGPVFNFEFAPGPLYTVSAAWVREEFRGSDLQVPRSRLSPIGAADAPRSAHHSAQGSPT